MVRRCRSRAGRARSIPVDGPDGERSAFRQRLDVVVTYRSGSRWGVAKVYGGVTRLA
jgi:hypothetical protein